MNLKHYLALVLVSGCLQADGQITSLYQAYCSVYGGWGTTSSGTLDGFAQDVVYPFGGPINPFSIPYGSSDSGTGGFRLGIWGQEGASRYIGLALDISYYRVDSSFADTSIDVIPITLMGLCRYPLMKTPDFPRGRVNPYLGVGASLVSANAKTLTVIDGAPVDVSVPMMGAGLDVRAGCSVDLTQRTAVFLEYRYLCADVEGASTDDDWYFEIPDYYAEMETDISTQQLLAGISVYIW